MRSMRSALKTLAIFLLAALMPVRAMAAVTTGFCPSGHADMAVAAHAEHGHAPGEHVHEADPSASKTPGSTCNVCVDHCSSAAFAPSVDGAIAARPASQERTHLAAHSVPAPLPDQLDRPLLA